MLEISASPIALSPSLRPFPFLEGSLRARTSHFLRPAQPKFVSTAIPPIPAPRCPSDTGSCVGKSIKPKEEFRRIATHGGPVDFELEVRRENPQADQQIDIIGTGP